MKSVRRLQLAAAVLAALLFLPFTAEIFGPLRPPVVRGLGIALLICMIANLACAIVPLVKELPKK